MPFGNNRFFVENQYNKAITHLAQNKHERIYWLQNIITFDLIDNMA